jgi:nicotinate-nucleotide adenylyltransferase
MKIGVFGGAFDPVHRGHVECAHAVRDEFALDRVLMIPLKHPVHKDVCTAPAADRLAMLRLALAGESGIIPDDCELRREGGSYTIDTLNELSVRFPGDTLYLITGADSFNTLRTWKEPLQIAASARFIVLERPGYRLDESIAEWVGGVLRAKNCLIDISSSEIRSGYGESQLHPDVVAYIRTRGLYRN